MVLRKPPGHLFWPFTFFLFLKDICFCVFREKKYGKWSFKKFTCPHASWVFLLDLLVVNQST